MTLCDAIANVNAMYNEPIRFVMTTFSFLSILVSGLSILSTRASASALLCSSSSACQSGPGIGSLFLLSPLVASSREISSVTKRKRQKQLFFPSVLLQLRDGLSWSRTSGPRPCQPTCFFSSFFSRSSSLKFPSFISLSSRESTPPRQCLSGGYLSFSRVGSISALD